MGSHCHSGRLCRWIFDRNGPEPFFCGGKRRMLLPRQAPEPYPITQIFDLEENLETDCACHAMRRYRLPYQGQVPAGSMLRRCKIEKHTKENS